MSFIGLVAIVGIMAVVQYFLSDKMILWSTGAEQVSEAEEPQLHAMIDRVAQRAGIASISKGAMQTAMKALVEKGFVWQPGSGRYAVDNLDMLDMHRRKKMPH